MTAKTLPMHLTLRYGDGEPVTVRVEVRYSMQPGFLRQLPTVAVHNVEVVENGLRDEIPPALVCMVPIVDAILAKEREFA